MKTNIMIVSLLILMTGCVFYGGKCNRYDKVIENKVEHPEYTASEQRKVQILNSWEKVQLGMNTEQVKQLLGYPDEVQIVNDPNNIFSNQETGNSYWYILERKEYDGSRYNKEALVRVIFDKSNMVRKIDKWGF